MDATLCNGPRLNRSMEIPVDHSIEAVENSFPWMINNGDSCWGCLLGDARGQ